MCMQGTSICSFRTNQVFVKYFVGVEGLFQFDIPP